MRTGGMDAGRELSPSEREYYECVVRIALARGYVSTPALPNLDYAYFGGVQPAPS